MVCSSFGHAVDLLVRKLPGHRFAVEEPDTIPRNRLLRDGRRVDPVAVDGEGLVVDPLRRTAARAVVVTPAHQSPTGVAMSPPRRNALVAWARDVDGYIVEDDFDAEFRYDRRPVGALQGLAPGARRLLRHHGQDPGHRAAPGLDGPPGGAGRRRGRAAGRGRRGDVDDPAGDVRAASSAGDLDRHLRRSRRVYRVRRDAVVAAVRRWLPQATVGGIAAGLNVVLTLPDGNDEQAVVARPASGLGVYPRGWFAADPGGARPGLVLGYGTVPPAAGWGVRVLGEVVPAG